MAGINPPNFLVNTELGASVLETIAERKLLEVALAATAGGTLAAAFIQNNLGGFDKAPGTVKNFIVEQLGNLEQDLGAPILQSFLKTALNVDLSDVSGQEAQAMRMIERAIGFGAGLPMIVGPVAGFLETKFGHHAPKEFLKALREIPHDIGMSFFLGTTLASIFETATRGPIGEAIQEQTRPTRLEWPQIARLLKAKQMPEDVALDKLRKAGFREEDLPHLLKLDNQLLSVSQVQKLHEIGWFDDGITQDYLDRLGFEPADRDGVLRIFSHEAASEGQASFRTIARNAFRDQYLSEDAYRGMLQEVQTPPESIDLLVAGVQLERDAGRLHLTIANIKDLYDHQHIGTDEVHHRLAVAGMNDNDIADLLVVWNDGKKVARTGLSSAKIISYQLGGVLTPKQAYDRLVLGGMRQEDAQFLVDNPSTHPQVSPKPISPATVVAAYKDDVLSIDEARAILKTLNIDPIQIELLLANANFTITKGKKPKQPTKTLSESNVLEALKFGLGTPAWAERELETQGYATADANLLVMIELSRLDADAARKLGWTVLN